MNLFQWMHRFVPQSFIGFKAVAVAGKNCSQDGAEETHFVSGIFVKDNVMDMLHPEMVMVTMFDPLPRGKFNPCRASKQ